MRKLYGLSAVVGLFLGSFLLAQGAVPLLTGPACQEASQLLSCLNQVISAVNTNVPAPSNTPRNLLDNGAMAVTQRGTGTVTCAQNAGVTSAAYVADRWGCQANVGAGAGQAAVITTSPAPPLGFTNSVKVWRNSGALTQPVCYMQEIPSNLFGVSQQGQQIVLSFYAAALAGLNADNGSVISANIFTGTSTDEGLGTPTASPAITPAWTGIATLQATNFTLTTSFGRFTTAPISVPTTVKEMAVAICFTPTATGAGATDGFAVTGIQLEQGTVATPFEFRNIQSELAQAQRYFTLLAEPAAGVQVPVVGNSTSTTAAAMAYAFPVTMRAAPTFTALGTALSGSTWTNKCGNVNNALATTFVVTASANTVNGASLTVTSSGSTIGFGCVLVGAGGGSTLSWSADF